ncbi:MAG: hypothetical protein ACR2IV_01475 [Bryobacteraceae bacterium]
MPPESELQDRFHMAFHGLTERAARELDYIPEEYLRRIRELGALQAAKALLAEAPSNDSLEIWVRGNRDLTIEALARSVEWQHLFSEQERNTAERRYADWSFEIAELDTLGGICQESDLEELFLPEDDIVWGQELAAGIDVCQKLAQENRSIQKGNPLNAGWTLAYYRTHLAECSTCGDKCGYLKRSLADLDRETLGSLADLLIQCNRILNIGQKRAV